MAEIDNVVIECNVDPELVLDEITPRDVVNYLGAKELLDEIGKDKAIKHFDLKLAD